MSFGLSRSRPARRAALTAFLAAFPGVNAGAETRPALPPVVGLTELRMGDALTGLGLSGLDPLTFFLEPVPRPGRPDIEWIWGGLAWRFASRANRAAFQRDPDAFMPRIGGYDASAAAAGHLASASPFISVRHRGRMYLFRSEESRRRFVADEAAAEAAESAWIRLRADLVRS